MARPGQAAVPVPVGGVLHRHHDAAAARAQRARGRAQRAGGQPSSRAALYAGILSRRQIR